MKLSRTDNFDISSWPTFLEESYSTNRTSDAEYKVSLAFSSTTQGRKAH